MLVWPDPTPGHYLMVFHDPNGIFNLDTDATDDFYVIGKVPLITPLGIVALLVLLSIVATSTIARKKRR